MCHLKTILSLMVILLSSKLLANDRQGGAYLPVADWTILVFMNGDNNLEPDAIDNFYQMAKIGSSQKINIIVQFDRIGKYDSRDSAWTQTLRFRVLKGMRPLPHLAVEDIGEADMGDSKVLEQFIFWGMKKYPAKHYMLDVWDHGQGYRLMEAELLVNNQRSRSNMAFSSYKSFIHPDQIKTTRTRSTSDNLVRVGDNFRSTIEAPFRSCSNDETDKDELYNKKIQDVLINVNKTFGRKIDLIGFDCCLMSMIETAYAMRNGATYMVGSEDLEPGSGWKYDDWLSQLVKLENNREVDGITLGRILVSSYQKVYNMSIPTTTLSMIDLSKVEQVVPTINTFAVTLQQVLSNQITQIKKARSQCLNFAPNHTNPNPFYHIDLILFCDLISRITTDNSLRTSALAAKNAVATLIISNYRGESRRGSFGSFGLAIYFPPNQTAYKSDKYAKNGYEKSNTFYPVEFVKTQRWSDFLHDYFQLVDK